MLDFFKELSHLKSLTIDYIPIHEFEENLKGIELKNLEKIILNTDILIPPDVRSILTMAPNLEALEFEAFINSIIIQTFPSDLIFPKIQSIKLPMDTYNSSFIRDLLSACPNLQFLDYVNLAATTDLSHPKLEKLKNGFPNLNVDILLKNFPNLKFLGHQSSKAISACSKKIIYPQISEIVLVENFKLHTFFDALKIFPNLKKLSFFWGDIIDDSKKTPITLYLSLKELSLLTPLDKALLTRILEYFPNLETLKILNYKGIFPTVNTKLERLVLHDSSIENLKTLKKHLPKLRTIIHHETDEESHIHTSYFYPKDSI